ncbi:MAG: hypothetical protein ACREBE_23245, partial [bacterium]
MSYESLADQLEGIVARLRKHADRLEGVPLANAATKLRTSLKAFDAALEASVRGTDPEIKELRDLLEGPGARAGADIKTVKLLAKRATGKALTLKATDAPQDQRRKFV